MTNMEYERLPVLLSIRGEQYFDDIDPDATELMTEGTMELSEEGLTLCYHESALTGMEGTVMPSEIGANLSLGGVSLAVAFKTKNSELRQTALAAASSALIAGTTEPALYGVAVRLKRPLIASLITGFVCGCLAGMAGLASRSMVSPSVLTGVQFIDPANPGVSIAWIAGISVLSIVLSFVLTLVIGFEDLPEEE